jgi:hypothetical protein
VEYLTTIPGNFKEHFVKYDANEQDTTVIIFDPEHLGELRNKLEVINEFIYYYYYEGDQTHYLKQGFHQRIVDKAKSEEERKKVSEMYDYLYSSDD